MKNLGVDIIYVLNRKKDFQRKEAVIKELSNIEGLNYQIITSVTGNTIDDIPDLIEDKKLFPIFTDPRGIITKNIIATAFTHNKAVNRFLESDYETCLIVEDDIKFANQFWKDTTSGKIDQIISEINQSDYDLIFWGRSRYIDYQEIANVGKVSENLHKTLLNTDFYGAHAYQLNKRSAKIISEKTIPVKFAADVNLESLDIKIYSPLHSYINQNPGPFTGNAAKEIFSMVASVGDDGSIYRSSTMEDYDNSYDTTVNGNYVRNVRECNIFRNIPIDKVEFKPRKLPNGRIVENWATVYLKKNK